jgi:hypothetical protein
VAITRVKDLPDLAVLATTGAIETDRLRLALEETPAFRSRGAASTT